MRNNHLFTRWGCIAASVRYGSRGSHYSFNESIYFGHCVSARTMLAKTECFRDNYKKYSRYFTEQCTNTIEREEEMNIVVMDNNQKGQRYKMQRGGKSSSYTVVTCSVALKCQFKYSRDMLSNATSSLASTNVPITYVKQVIPSPFGMHDYENIVGRGDVNEYLIKYKDHHSGDFNSPDFTGDRVSSYMTILETVSLLYYQKKFLSSPKKLINL